MAGSEVHNSLPGGAGAKPACPAGAVLPATGLRWRGRLQALIIGLVAALCAGAGARAAALSDPQVDAYNVRVSTETFAGLYKFTSDTLLVETARAITNLGSDTIKFYLGANTAYQSGVTLPPNVTNLITLARDEPSYRKVFDMPFRNMIVWAYPLSNGDAPFTDGDYTPTEQTNDYREMYDLTCYLLTNYNNSGKTFYLGHWEGDGYLKVNNWTTNPSPAVISGMIAWLNNRQKAVDDAKRAVSYTNVNVFNYAEANRVRDAMLNGPTNNQRVINMVVPYVTNLDYLSYSSYDAENLSASDLYATLNYMESMLPTNKAPVVPGPRIWIGEYGWGGYSTDTQEPLNRAYIQRLLNWNYKGRCLPFILFWEIYDNETNRNFCLVDSNDVKVASWHLQHDYINDARLLTAQFKETHGRLPTDTEFTSLVSPLLDQPVAEPVALALTNTGALLLSATNATLSGTLAQGIYGDQQASVWVYYGRRDGGTNFAGWESARYLGVNTNFNPATFSVTVNNLAPDTNYFFRYYASNSGSAAWASSSAQFSTAVLVPSDYGSRLKISFPGYDRGESLFQFPVLVRLGPGLPGFSYRQFASPTGGDLRFAGEDGLTSLPFEIDEWNTNGVSSVWVDVPRLSGTNDFIWAYWGNPGQASLQASSTNGAAWPGYDLVWHLQQTGFPYADSTLLDPAVSGIQPGSTAGEIGRGCWFNGTSDFLQAGPVNPGDAFTVSAWVKLDPGAVNIQTIWANKASGWNSSGFSLYANSYNTTNGELILETGDGVGGTSAATPTGLVSPGQWHQVAAAIDKTAGTVDLYVDGTGYASSAVDTNFPGQGAITMGCFTNRTFFFKGILDETRIRAGVCSPNWMWAGWMNVASNASFESESTVTQTPPVLSIVAGANNGPTLQWPASGVGFALYTATNLAPPVVWTPATNQPALVNNQWQIALPPGGQAGRFYRLQSQ